MALECHIFFFLTVSLKLGLQIVVSHITLLRIGKSYFLLSLLQAAVVIVVIIILKIIIFVCCEIV